MFMHSHVVLLRFYDHRWFVSESVKFCKFCLNTQPGDVQSTCFNACCLNVIQQFEFFKYQIQTKKDVAQTRHQGASINTFPAR